MGYGNQKGPQTPPPAQSNERLSRVKELAVTTAMQLVGMDLQQRAAGGLSTPKDLLNDFVKVYREVYDELTYLPED